MMMPCSSRLMTLWLVSSVAAGGFSPLQRKEVDPRMDENCFMNTTGDPFDYDPEAPCYDYFELGSVCQYNTSYGEKSGKPLSPAQAHPCFCKPDGYFSAFAKCDGCLEENGGRYIADWIGSDYYSALSSSFCAGPTTSRLNDFIPSFYSSYLATASVTSPSTATATATTTPAATGIEPTATDGARFESCGLKKPLLSGLIAGGALAML